jgi:hypothetical protein
LRELRSLSLLYLTSLLSSVFDRIENSALNRVLSLHQTSHKRNLQNEYSNYPDLLRIPTILIALAFLRFLRT